MSSWYQGIWSYIKLYYIYIYQTKWNYMLSEKVQGPRREFQLLSAWCKHVHWGRNCKTCTFPSFYNLLTIYMKYRSAFIEMPRFHVQPPARSIWIIDNGIRHTFTEWGHGWRHVQAGLMSRQVSWLFGHSWQPHFFLPENRLRLLHIFKMSGWTPSKSGEKMRWKTCTDVLPDFLKRIWCGRGGKGLIHHLWMR